MAENGKRGQHPNSRANLKQYGGPTHTHGAHSESLIRATAEAYLAELQEEFPAASERVLRLQARRLAKLDRLASYLERKGEIRHQRRGEVFPASALEEKIAAAYLAEHDRLEQQQREAAAPNTQQALAHDLAASSEAWQRHEEAS
jgi:CRP-like cAMP-binding protein